MRKILLVEPNYRNKYPPMGLMKLSTYFKNRGDDVRFYKGDIKLLPIQLITEDFIEHLELLYPDVFWKEYYPLIFKYIRTGKYTLFDGIEVFKDEGVVVAACEYRRKYKNKDYFKYPRYDRVCITTLFTFYWDITIDTINFVKQLCKKPEGVIVGGIMSTLLPNEVYTATMVKPVVGLLINKGDIDDDNENIIDHLPLDYSILDEIDYEYPANDAYFSYTTRGCINHCAFCAVPKLEPKYCDYISLKDKIEETTKRFGVQRNLLLLDNNVLASSYYNKIIDEIKECGFGKNAKSPAQNQYAISIKNLRDGVNDRAYIKKIVKLYQFLLSKLKKETTKTELYLRLEEARCLHDYTATKEAIFSLDDFVSPLFEAVMKPSLRTRYVDFNQGIDSRLITDDNMKKLSEVNIKPLRIAFDHWELRKVYETAVRSAVNNGIKHLSNYLLYNFKDKPEHLYNRLRLNVDLCEELDATIYSFPMKYHPINDPLFFSNRDFIGEHWNRKFIRAVQAVLNATKGKIGRGVEFFEEAFGKDLDEFYKILWMPETFIIYRRKYDAKLREKLAERYTNRSSEDCDLANEWWSKFNKLNDTQLKIAKEIIAKNQFADGDFECCDTAIIDVLRYYKLPRK